MDKKKIVNKIFWKIFLALLFGYMALYISEQTGYYEFEQHKKVVLTEESIKKFEKDIKDGKSINVKNYIDEKEESYQNNISKTGILFSNIIGEIVQNGIAKTFDFLNNIFND